MNTSHGQHMWGTSYGPPYFGKIVNCGGSRVCVICKKETDEYHKEHPPPERKKAL